MSATTVSLPAMVLSYVALLAWTFVVLFPLYWLVVTALKTPLEVNAGPFYIPFRDFKPTLDSWHYIFYDLREDTFRPYLNTVVVGLTSTAITVLLGSMAAYGLVRMRYRVGYGAIASFVVVLPALPVTPTTSPPHRCRAHVPSASSARCVSPTNNSRSPPDGRSTTTAAAPFSSAVFT